MKNKFLIKFKNTIPLVKNKDKNLILTLSYLKKPYLRLTPKTVLIKSCERLAPGVKLLPYVKSGKVHYIPGKIKYLSSMYYGLKWLLESIQQPMKTKYNKRLSIEIKNITKRTGAALNQKRLFIKELRKAKLNAKRRKFWIKYLSRKRFRRLRKRKIIKLKKKYKKLKIKKYFYIRKKWKKRKKFKYKRKLFFIKKKKRKKKKMKFWKKTLKRKGKLRKFSKKKPRYRLFKKAQKVLKKRIKKKKIAIRNIWKRVRKKDYILRNL